MENWPEMQRRENGQRIESPVFIPGDDFDPRDPEEVEIVEIATGQHRNEALEYYRAETARLRSLLEDIQAEEAAARRA